ncbi:hypothetical protein [Flavihumibacter sp. CACIAM 22H1]|uniref:class I SAM-dependent methyltransferase n=1 Tax=Flavihumibacter sp. CACIAM 22H1 TaxID=1812911 RepID=UPI0007A8CC69|nr:hypothetical protein [Flavihumibacter sp. CACIAM 22H1]KYP16201.1 MAG: hypothetical protein A1D16_14175 [Flavihumibacter sp. CACIAM 22H1]
MAKITEKQRYLHIQMITTAASFRQFKYRLGSLLIQVPDEQQIQVAYETARKNDPAIDFPFWARIWPSALVLAAYLDNHPELYKGKRVVEIAAGLGLPALLAAKEAKQVIVSDYQPAAIACMNASIAANAYTNIEALLYNWRHGLPDWEADLLLLSDTNYSPQDLAAVEQLIRFYLNQGTQVLLSTPHRLAGRDMLLALSAYCKETCVQELEEQTLTIYRYSKNL